LQARRSGRGGGEGDAGEAANKQERIVLRYKRGRTYAREPPEKEGKKKTRGAAICDVWKCRRRGKVGV